MLAFFREFCRYFKKDHHLLTQEVVPLSKDLAYEDKNWLIRPALEEEVRQAVFQLTPLKEPGPDDMYPIFFDKCWSILGKNITHMVQKILSSAFLLKSLNRAYISLITKKEIHLSV